VVFTGITGLCFEGGAESQGDYGYSTAVGVLR
jgi:hypothetical protein